jgi:hypothetical protein
MYDGYVDFILDPYARPCRYMDLRDGRLRKDTPHRPRIPLTGWTKLSANFYHKRQGYIDAQSYSETSKPVSMSRYQMILTP